MTQSIFLAGGCFWCTEAIFLSLNGVIEVTPVYLGGKNKNPTYEEICTGETGHAEAIKCVFDEKKISISKILEIFFNTHNPTELNRQGNDIGTQYRSEIFIINNDQLKEAQEALEKAQKCWESKIQTKITVMKKFYIAENYHKNYYNNNSNTPYCKFVIKPKLEKLEKQFKKLLKN